MRPIHTATHLLTQVDPHRQCVDEQSQCPVNSLSALHPTEQHRSKHHVVPTRGTPQHLRIRQMEQARCAHSQCPRSCAHSTCQALIHLHTPLADLRSVPLHIAH